MKKIFFIMTILSQIASAHILNSQLENRHQEVIKSAVLNNCQLNISSFSELKTIATPIKVDQGILDYAYKTELELKVKIDQMVFDYYLVTVESYYTSGYNHEKNEWGIYEVLGVSSCMMK